VANDPNNSTGIDLSGGFVQAPSAQSMPQPTSQPTASSKSIDLSGGFVNPASDSQTQAGSRQSSDSNSQPGAFSRFVSGALDEAKGAVTGAVQTAGQVARAVVNPPQDAHETIAYNVGGPGGLVAYRAAQKIVSSTQDMVKAKKETFEQAKTDFAKSAIDLHNGNWRQGLSDAASTGGDLLSLNPATPSGVGERVRELSEGARPGGDLATPLGKTATDIGMAALDSDTVGKVAKLPGKITDAVAEKMYQSTLKPGPRSFTPEEVESMVQTGLENKIPVSKAGIKKLDSLVSDLNSKIAAEIKAGSDAGATVNKYKVASRLGDTADKFKTQVNPDADLAAVGKSGNEFLESQPNEISASDAQALKQGTYRQIGSKAYGELSSATKESQKALARGIKEELADQFPEIVPKNAQEAKLLGLDDALETAVNRTRNHNLVSLGAKAAYIAGGATFGGTEGAALGGGLALLHEVLSHPAVQSHLAIAIARASKIPYKEALGKVGAYASSLNASSTRQSDDTAASASGNPAEWVKVKATDGETYEIHPSDLAEAQKRDPGVQLVAPN